MLKLPSSEFADPDIVAEAVASLQRGALVVIPTDTVYGVAAGFFNKKAVARLHQIKKRPLDKPIPILASDCRQIESLKAHFGKLGKELARRYWPGPLTLVLAVGESWEGFRIPNHNVALAIIKAAGGLLRVTSANLSGNAPALTAFNALKELSNGIELAIDAGTAPGGVPSTVVKIMNEKAVILREGAIRSEEIYDIALILAKDKFNLSFRTK